MDSRLDSGDSMLLSVAKPLMACEFEVLLNQNQYSQGAEQALAALSVVERLEQLWSVYKPRSELSTLNRFGSQRAVAISQETLDMLRLAQELHQLTAGAFDITAGSLSEAWGFSRRAGAMPSPLEIQAALQCVGTQHLQLDLENLTASLSREGVLVNPGGIGKGFALDRSASVMHQAGIHDFMMHGGLSSVVAQGDRRHSATGGGWLVALKHPWRLTECLGTIRLRNQALGTSGSGKQFFHFGGRRYSHIIDPRSGMPAQGMLSASVICPSGAIADALATALFVMGVEAARQFCEQQPQIAAILVHLDSKSGKQQIELCNIHEDVWLPNSRSQGIRHKA